MVTRKHHASNPIGEGEAAAPGRNLKVAFEDAEGVSDFDCDSTGVGD